MKKYILLILLMITLSGCNPFDDYELMYDQDLLKLEINEIPEYENIFDIEYTHEFDDSNVDYTTLGSYTLDVFVEEGTNKKHFEVPVEVVDTISPSISIPEDFQTYYEPGSDLDLSGITTSDNSGEEITLTTNAHSIDMNELGEYKLVLTATDSSGNLLTTSLDIIVRTVVVPMISIEELDVSDNYFTVRFVEEDPQEHKIESSYEIYDEEDNLVASGAIRNEYEFKINDLHQDTLYTVKLIFEYQVPGEEEVLITNIIYVETEVLFAPMIDLDNLDVMDMMFAADLEIIDPDELLESVIFELVLVSSGEVVDTMEYVDQENVTFEELTPNTEYQLRVVYEYDFNDGEGVMTYTDTYDFQTLE